MKKNNLFAILLCIMVGLLLLTWFIPAGYFESSYISQGIMVLGIGDFLQYLVLTFFQSMFIELLLFLFAVGLFYGVLNKTTAYRNILEKIAKKLNKKGNLALIIIAFLFAALTSFGGYGLLLFIFVPFVVSIVLLMGHDKITACLVTFGAMLIGLIGTTIGTNYIMQIVTSIGLEYTSQWLYKVILFVLAFALLVIFTLKRAKNNKVKDLAQYDDVLLGGADNDKRKNSPVAFFIIFGLVFVLFVLGCTQWSTFGIEVFNNLHSNVVSAKIFGVKIFDYLLGSTVVAFGNWSYFQISIVLVIASIVLGKLYKLSFRQIFEGMEDGCKNIAKPALLTVFAYSILILTVNTGVVFTIIDYIYKVKANLFTAGLSTVISSIFSIEFPYIGSFYLPQISASIGNVEVLNVMTQALFGLVMFVSPTSLFLLLGLSYLDIPYKKWLKNIWKLLVTLFLLIVIILIAMVLIIK